MYFTNSIQSCHNRFLKAPRQHWGEHSSVLLILLPPVFTWVSCTEGKWDWLAQPLG